MDKLRIAVLLLSLAFLLAVTFEANGMINDDMTGLQNTPAVKMDCGGACAGRCRLSSRPRLCKRACGTCCARCNCVPPGTSGNLHACPCYANMTTHGGRRKCP